MRNVDSKEIAHLWAHQSQPSATCAAAMSFDGPAFKSYGVTIGEIVGSGPDRVYLLTKPGSYGVTTSRHQNEMINAVPRNAITFTVPGESRHNGGRFTDPSRIMAAWTLQVERTLAQANSAKRDQKKTRIMGDAAKIVSEMRRFAKVMGLKKQAYPVIPGTPADLAAAIERETKRKARIAAKAKRAREAQQQKNLAAWLQGENVDVSDLPTALRIVEDEIQTSRGAYLPVSHGRRALALVDRVRARGEEWKTNGHTCHVGHYQIDRIAEDGTVYAGCHVVPFESIERIRPALLTIEA